MGRLLQQLIFGLFSMAVCGASLYAAPLTAHKVSSLPTLSPLAMSVGGRMRVTPSASANRFGDRDYTYQWPGSYFRAAFSGAEVFFRVVKGNEILHIAVDGQSAEPLVKPEAGVYEVDGLGKGKHEIEIFVATESQSAPNTFGGFAIPFGEKALKAAQRHRQIEFIGDSHTVGYGDISATRQCTEAKIWSNTDDTRAFGAMTSAHYHADYQVNAISGRGVVRNYNGFKADTLPQAYPYVLFDKQEKYSDSGWHPQVIVIALGTNDFSTPLNPGEQWKTREELHVDYETTYLKFLQHLRARDRNAYIIVWATDTANGEVEAESQNVVQQMKRQGDRRITFLPIQGLSFSACDWHPSLKDETIISDKLIRTINADKHVWKRR